MGEDTKQKMGATRIPLFPYEEHLLAYLRIFQAPERYAPGLFDVNELLSLHQELESINKMKEENDHAFIQID